VGAGFLKYTACHATMSDTYVFNDELAPDVTQNVALEAAAADAVQAFKTHIPVNEAAMAIEVQPLTTPERIANSHLAAALMPDRAPCFEQYFQKSFPGVFSEFQGLYEKNVTTSNASKRKKTYLNSDIPQRPKRNSTALSSRH